MTVDEVLAPVRERIEELEQDVEGQRSLAIWWSEDSAKKRAVIEQLENEILETNQMLALGLKNVEHYRNEAQRAKEKACAFDDAHAKLEKTLNICTADLEKKNHLIEGMARAHDIALRDAEFWKTQFQDVQEDAGKWRNLMAELKRRTQEQPVPYAKFVDYGPEENVHQSPYSNMTYYTTGEF